MWHFRLFLSISLCFVIRGVGAQSPLEINYTMQDGLPSNFVYRAVQDSLGFIWFCTDKGLVKFDGTRFQTIKVNDGLPQNDIYDIHLDIHGKLWLSTFNSICYITIKNNEITCLDMPYYSKNGMVLHEFNNGTNHFITIRGEPSGHYIERQDSLIKFENTGFPIRIEDENTYIQFETQSERVFYLQKYESGELKTSNYINSYTKIFKYGHVQIQENLYFFEPDTAYIWTGQTLERKAYSDLWDINPDIYSVKFDKGNIVIQGHKDNFVVNKDLKITDTLDYLLKKNFNSFIQDAEGNIWLCTNNGVSYILNNPHTSKQYIIEDKEDNFATMTKNSSGQVYVATNFGKLYKFETTTGLQLIEDYNFEKVQDIKFSSNENSVILLDAVLGIYKIGIVKRNDAKEINLDGFIISRGSIKFFDNSKPDSLLIAHSNGVHILSKDTLRYVYNKRTYASLFVQDSIYIGTTAGLYLSSNNEVSKIGNGDFNLYIQNLYKDDSGRIWVMPNAEGLWMIRNNTLQEINSAKSLFINNITQDEESNYWLASSSGLYKMTYEYPDQEYTIVRYGNSYGITEENIVDVCSANNYIYAISEEHFYELPQGESQHSKLSHFYFQDPVINNESRHRDSINDLSHKENSIEIKFNSISFSDLGQFTYQWKLLPNNTEWQFTSDNTLLFNSLSPGSYTLIVKTIDSSGEVLHEQEELKFKINKPWYGTKAFYAGIGILSLLIFFTIDKIRQHRLQVKSDNEYETQREFFELKLKAVQAQMNPHFIFNALNSIQRFIYQKSPEEANQYIVKFAKLMRMILESTSKNYSTLDEEIELLKNYISLEQLRFDESFKFHLEIQEDIIPGEVLIPSTILQPFVENAINHGLAPKAEQGNLWIRVSLKMDKLVCEVEDDGIGREEASRLRKTNHTSRALTIIEERKKILMKRDNYFIDFFYTDRLDHKNNITGTKLTLSIPI